MRTIASYTEESPCGWLTQYFNDPGALLWEPLWVIPSSRMARYASDRFKPVSRRAMPARSPWHSPDSWSAFRLHDVADVSLLNPYQGLQLVFLRHNYHHCCLSIHLLVASRSSCHHRNRAYADFRSCELVSGIAFDPVGLREGNEIIPCCDGCWNTSLIIWLLSPLRHHLGTVMVAAFISFMPLALA